MFGFKKLQLINYSFKCFKASKAEMLIDVNVAVSRRVMSL